MFQAFPKRIQEALRNPPRRCGVEVQDRFPSKRWNQLVGQIELYHDRTIEEFAARPTTAFQAIDTIVEQGEGAKAHDEEVPLDPVSPVFNASYSYVLALIDELFTTSRTTENPGQISRRYGLEHAAPPFEFYAFAPDPPKKDQLEVLCDELLGVFPALGGDNGVRKKMISFLPSV